MKIKSTHILIFSFVFILALIVYFQFAKTKTQYQTLELNNLVPPSDDYGFWDWLKNVFAFDRITY